MFKKSQSSIHFVKVYIHYRKTIKYTKESENTFFQMELHEKKRTTQHNYEEKSNHEERKYYKCSSLSLFYFNYWKRKKKTISVNGFFDSISSTIIRSLRYHIKSF